MFESVAGYWSRLEKMTIYIRHVTYAHLTACYSCEYPKKLRTFMAQKNYVHLYISLYLHVCICMYMFYVSLNERVNARNTRECMRILFL